MTEVAENFLISMFLNAERLISNLQCAMQHKPVIVAGSSRYDELLIVS